MRIEGWTPIRGNRYTAEYSQGGVWINRKGTVAWYSWQALYELIDFIKCSETPVALWRKPHQTVSVEAFLQVRKLNSALAGCLADVFQQMRLATICQRRPFVAIGRLSG